MTYIIDFYYDNGCTAGKSYGIVDAENANAARTKFVSMAYKYSHTDTSIEVSSIRHLEDVFIVGKENL